MGGIGRCENGRVKLPPRCFVHLDYLGSKGGGESKGLVPADCLQQLGGTSQTRLDRLAQL